MSVGAWQTGASRAEPLYLPSLFIIFTILFLAVGAQADNCDDCELTHANLTNIAITNATDISGKLIGPKIIYAKVNATFCGCPDLNNFVMVNSTDNSGRDVGPKMDREKINLTYWAGLEITKRPSLVTDLDQVGLDLALVEYNITVNNTGEVNVTGIKIHDTLLGDYIIVNLTPGQEVTLSPHPEYIVTQNDTKYCGIFNRAEVTGNDRCCNPVEDYALANFPISANNLEDYLKIYSVELHELGYDLKHSPPSAEKLEDFEQKIRIQANRLMTFEDILHGNFTCETPESDYLPAPPQEQICCSNCARQS
jgi:uncharacterized repeat protein (TIGR01451 family)